MGDLSNDQRLNLEQLKGFNIPRKIKNGILVPIERKSQEEKSVLQDIAKTKLTCDEEKYWGLCSIKHISNPALEDTFSKKRKELKAEGKKCSEEFAFCLALQKDLEDLIHEGPRNRQAQHISMGNPTMGVTLFRHLDVLLKFAKVMDYKSPLRVIVFKVALGKTKMVMPRSSITERCLDPTPNFDSHVSGIKPTNADKNFDLFERSSVFLYEYDDCAMPVLRPRQCLPFAIVYYASPVMLSAHSKLNFDQHLLTPKKASLNKAPFSEKQSVKRNLISKRSVESPSIKECDSKSIIRTKTGQSKLKSPKKVKPESCNLKSRKTVKREPEDDLKSCNRVKPESSERVEDGSSCNKEDSFLVNSAKDNLTSSLMRRILQNELLRRKSEIERKLLDNGTDVELDEGSRRILEISAHLEVGDMIEADSCRDRDTIQDQINVVTNIDVPDNLTLGETDEQEISEDELENETVTPIEEGKTVSGMPIGKMSPNNSTTTKNKTEKALENSIPGNESSPKREPDKERSYRDREPESDCSSREKYPKGRFHNRDHKMFRRPPKIFERRPRNNERFCNPYFKSESRFRRHLYDKSVKPVQRNTKRSEYPKDRDERVKKCMSKLSPDDALNKLHVLLQQTGNCAIEFSTITDVLTGAVEPEIFEAQDSPNNSVDVTTELKSENQMNGLVKRTTGTDNVMNPTPITPSDSCNISEINKTRFEMEDNNWDMTSSDINPKHDAPRDIRLNQDISFLGSKDMDYRVFPRNIPRPGGFNQQYNDTLKPTYCNQLNNVFVENSVISQAKSMLPDPMGLCPVNNTISRPGTLNVALDCSDLNLPGNNVAKVASNEFLQEDISIPKRADCKEKDVLPEVVLLHQTNNPVLSGQNKCINEKSNMQGLATSDILPEGTDTRSQSYSMPNVLQDNNPAYFKPVDKSKELSVKSDPRLSSVRLQMANHKPECLSKDSPQHDHPVDILSKKGEKSERCKTMHSKSKEDNDRVHTISKSQIKRVKCNRPLTCPFNSILASSVEWRVDKLDIFVDRVRSVPQIDDAKGEGKPKFNGRTLLKGGVPPREIPLESLSKSISSGELIDPRRHKSKSNDTKTRKLKTQRSLTSESESFVSGASVDSGLADMELCDSNEDEPEIQTIVTTGGERFDDVSKRIWQLLGDVKTSNEPHNKETVGPKSPRNNLKGDQFTELESQTLSQKYTVDEEWSKGQPIQVVCSVYSRDSILSQNTSCTEQFDYVTDVPATGDFFWASPNALQGVSEQSFSSFPSKSTEGTAVEKCISELRHTLPCNKEDRVGALSDHANLLSDELRSEKEVDNHIKSGEKIYKPIAPSTDSVSGQFDARQRINQIRNAKSNPGGWSSVSNAYVPSLGTSGTKRVRMSINKIFGAKRIRKDHSRACKSPLGFPAYNR